MISNFHTHTYLCKHATGDILDYLENNKVEVYFESYQGGCIHLNATKNLQIGSTYDLKELKDKLVKYKNPQFKTTFEERYYGNNVEVMYMPEIDYDDATYLSRQNYNYFKKFFKSLIKANIILKQYFQINFFHFINRSNK